MHPYIAVYTASIAYDTAYDTAYGFGPEVPLQNGASSLYLPWLLIKHMEVK